MSAPVHELAALLRALFQPGELREWLHHREGFEFFLNLPADDEALAEAAAASLERHARVSVDFFHALLSSRPHRVDQIAKVAALCGLAPDATVLAGARARAGQSAPEPQFTAEGSRVVSERLDALYVAREERVIAGQDTAALDAQILELRRELRHGPRLQPGEFLDGGRYRLLEQVGQGGYGAVWRAYDRESRGLVAIKVLHGHWSGERERRERFFRGAQRMSELNHEGVVRVLRPRLEDQGFHAFVMELLSGGDLHGAVRSGALDTNAALEKVLRVGEALAFAHERGLVHRDVKPHNVLLDAKGNPKLCDFDLVKDLDYSGSHTGGAMGTWVYASPELRRDAKHVDARADVYGLGMTAVYCVFRSDLPHDAVYDPVEFVGHLVASPALRAVLARAVQPDPERRTPSMAAFCEALARAMAAPATDRPARVDELARLLAAGDEPHRAAALAAALAMELGFQAGDVVADATLLERGGEGATAVVWRGRRLADDRDVAVRVIRPELLTVGRTLASFRQGYETLAAIGGRNGRSWLFPTVYARSEDGLAYTMDWIPGGQARGEPLTLLTAVAEALGELDGPIAALCDLRPHNLLRAPDGRLALVDFDLPDREAEAPPESDPDAPAAVFRFGRLARGLLGGPRTSDPWLDGLSTQPQALQRLVWECLREDPAARPALADLPARLRLPELDGLAPPLGREDAKEPPQTTGWRSLLAAAVVLLVVGGVLGRAPLRALLLGTEVTAPTPTEQYLALNTDLESQLSFTTQEMERRDALADQLGRLEIHVAQVAATVASADADAAAPLREVLARREQELTSLRDEVVTLNGDLEGRWMRLEEKTVEAESLREAAIAAGAPATELPRAPALPEKPRVEPPARGEGRHDAMKPAPMPFFEVGEGSFTMGSGAADAPAHLVTVSAFYVAEGPVTRQQWELLMGPRGRPVVPNPTAPKEGLSWCDAVRFANRMSVREKLQPVYDGVPEQGCEHPERVRWNPNARGYRLPTEAEWEASARFTQPEGPEWVWDRYDAAYFATSPPRDPVGPPTGGERVLRAGPERAHAAPDAPPPDARVRLVLEPPA